MTTLTIKVNDKIKAVKSFIQFIKSLPFVSIESIDVQKNTTISGLDEAIEDIKNGPVYTANSTKDLFEQIIS
jgi:hypothetical protein